MRILILEDYLPLLTSICECLTEEGYAIDSSTTGDEGLWFANNHDYDVILLDIMLPNLSGLEILQKIRSSGNNVPVILISARDTVAQRIEGLECGADDYLIKPFALEELVARVRAQIRRHHQKKSPLIEIGDVIINPTTKTVFRGNHEISLTRREFNLLECFAFKKDEVISRDYIARHAYEDYEGGSSNVVDVYVGYLRKKLNVDNLPNVIETRRGHGYILLSNPK